MHLLFEFHPSSAQINGAVWLLAASVIAAKRQPNFVRRIRQFNSSTRTNAFYERSRLACRGQGRDGLCRSTFN